MHFSDAFDLMILKPKSPSAPTMGLRYSNSTMPKFRSRYEACVRLIAEFLETLSWNFRHKIFNVLYLLFGSVSSSIQEPLRIIKFSRVLSLTLRKLAFHQSIPRSSKTCAFPDTILQSIHLFLPACFLLHGKYSRIQRGFRLHICFLLYLCCSSFS